MAMLSVNPVPELNHQMSQARDSVRTLWIDNEQSNESGYLVP